MAVPSVTFTLVNGTTTDATQVNQNFTDLVNSLTDGTADLTIDTLTMNGALAITGNFTLDGALVMDESVTDQAAVAGHNVIWFSATNGHFYLRASNGDHYQILTAPIAAP